VRYREGIAGYKQVSSHLENPFNQHIMKTKNTLLIVICFIAAISCRNKHEYMEADVSAEMMVTPGSQIPPPPPPKNQGQYNPKLVKKGELTISSKDMELTKELVYRFIKECNGYVINENFTNNDYNTYFDISLNIQASLFDLFLKKLDSSKINIVSRTFSVEDISMNYIDDSTRLCNKKKLERKYLDLLTKSKEIKNLLEIEEKLEEIQTDIEVKESQIKLLDKQIAYSEIKIKIEKNITNLTYEDRTRFTYKLSQGFVKGWEAIKVLLIFLLTIWPFYILIALIFFVIKPIIKKRKKKK